MEVEDESELYICDDDKYKALVVNSSRKNENFTSKILVFKDRSGRIGFDANESGLSLLSELFHDAWGWDELEKKMKKFETVEDPLSFFHGMKTKEFYSEPLIFHRPKDELLRSSINKRENTFVEKIKGLSLMSASEKKSFYHDYLKVVEFISVWRTAQLEATILTYHYDLVFSRVNDICAKLGVKVVVAKNVNELPEW